MIKSIVDDIIFGLDPETGRLLHLEKMVSWDDFCDFVFKAQKIIRARYGEKYSLPVESMKAGFQLWLQKNEELGGMCRIQIKRNTTFPSEVYKRKIEITYLFGKLDFNISEESSDDGYFVYEEKGTIIFHERD